MTKLFKMSSASAVAIGLLTAGLLLHSPQSRAANSDDAKVELGLKMAPVPLNMKGKSRTLVGLGSYLVNGVAGCNDCHTWRKTNIAPNFGTNYAPGGDPFAGEPEQIAIDRYLAGGRDFGPFRSRNLTPDAAGVVADGWPTFKEIMRHGFDPDHLLGPAPLQVMPWPIYRNMSESDLRAIYEYLTAIPCIDGNPGEAFGPGADGHPTGRCGH